MNAEERTVGLPPLRERVRDQAPIWTAFFGGPAAWGLRLAVSYLLVPFVCATGAMWLVHLVSGVAVVLALLASGSGIAVWRRSREQRDGGASDVRERDGFLGLAGAFLSALFAAVIVLESTANLLVDPCLAAGVPGAVGS